MSDDERKKEQLEIARIITQCKMHGNFSAGTTNKEMFIPVIMSNDCRDQVIQNLKDSLDFCRL